MEKSLVNEEKGKKERTSKSGMKGADGGGRKTWGTSGSIHLKETEGGKNEALSAQVRDCVLHAYHLRGLTHSGH